MITLLSSLFTSAAMEELYEQDDNQVYVTTRLLNGRSKPRKTAKIEAIFDKGDTLCKTGNWSDDRHWIEVYGGESGTVWVYTDYISEISEPFIVQNIDYNQVKIRSKPIDGKVKGYLKRNKSVEILQVIDNWGRCSKGWIDLSLLEEVD